MVGVAPPVEAAMEQRRGNGHGRVVLRVETVMEQRRGNGDGPRKAPLVGADMEAMPALPGVAV
jgi:hypothetical protein